MTLGIQEAALLAQKGACLNSVDNLVIVRRDLGAIHVPRHAPSKQPKEGQADEPPHAANAHT